MGKNIYALRLTWKLKKKYVIHTIMSIFLGYFQWIFYSVFFVKFVINAIEQQLEFKRIMIAILGIGFITLLMNIYTTYVNCAVFPVLEIDMHKDLYKSLYKKAENVELECYENAEFYDKYTMAVDEAFQKVSSTIRFLSECVFGIIGGIITFWVIFQIDHFAMLFLISPIVGNILLGKIENKIFYEKYTDEILSKRQIAYVNRVMYIPDYAKEMRTSNIVHLLHDIYLNAVSDILRIARKYKNKLVVVGGCRYICSYTVIFEGLLIYIIYRTMISQSILLSELAVITSAMVTASYIWISVMSSMVDMNKNGILIGNIINFMNYKPKLPEDYEGIKPSKQVNSIEFCNVSFAYQENGPLVLNQVSFKIENINSVALVGFNGAGKSTIIKLMLRLYDPLSGEILVNGINIKKYNLQEYRKLFAVTFQDFSIMADTVKNNVLMGNHMPKEDQSVIDTLRKVGLLDEINKYPDGIEANVTKEFDSNGIVFSGGQSQKMIVARTLINKAPVKVYDEPSSALDPLAEQELFECILDQKNEGLNFFISHRLSSTKMADLIIVIEKETIAEIGTHNELMTKKGKYYNMFRKQAVNYFD